MYILDKVALLRLVKEKYYRIIFVYSTVKFFFLFVLKKRVEWSISNPTNVPSVQDNKKQKEEKAFLKNL